MKNKSQQNHVKLSIFGFEWNDEAEASINLCQQKIIKLNICFVVWMQKSKRRAGELTFICRKVNRERMKLTQFVEIN